VKSTFRIRYAGIILMGLAAAGSLTACGGDSGPSAKTNADYLKDAVATMKAAKTYHMDVDVTQSGQQAKISGDIDLGSNNLKLSMGMAGQTVDIIKVGEDYFSSVDGGATYTKSDASAVPDFSSFYGMWETIKSEDVDKAKDGLKDGTPPTEQIGGTETKHITGANKDLGDFVSGSDEGTIDFWVTTDAKPTVRQMKVTSSEVNGTFNWSKIDEPITITAPPVSLRLDPVASR
jgi:hypothetical protein